NDGSRFLGQRDGGLRDVWNRDETPDSGRVRGEDPGESGRVDGDEVAPSVRMSPGGRELDVHGPPGPRARKPEANVDEHLSAGAPAEDRGLDLAVAERRDEG